MPANSPAAAVNLACDLAAAAVGEGNYAEAEKQLTKAGVLLAGLPDGGGKGSSMAYDREGINRMLAEVRRAKAEAAAEAAAVDYGGGILRIPVEYARG